MQGTTFMPWFGLTFRVNFQGVVKEMPTSKLGQHQQTKVWLNPASWVTESVRGSLWSSGWLVGSCTHQSCLPVLFYTALSVCGTQHRAQVHKTWGGTVFKSTLSISLSECPRSQNHCQTVGRVEDGLQRSFSEPRTWQCIRINHGTGRHSTYATVIPEGEGIFQVIVAKKVPKL